MPDAPALSLDQFTEITVRIQFGRARPDVLKAAEVDDATFTSAQSYWLGKLASLTAKGDRVLYDRYLARCREVEDELRGTPLVAGEGGDVDRPEPRLAPLRRDPLVATEAAPPSVAQPVAQPVAAPVAPIEPSVGLPPTPIAIAAAPVDLGSTMGGPSPWAPKPAALPFEPNAPGPAGVQVRPAAAPESTPDPMAATQPEGATVPDEVRALPFGAKSKRAVDREGVSPMPFAGGEDAPKVRPASVETATHKRVATGTAAISATDAATLEKMIAQAQGFAGKSAREPSPDLGSTVGVGDISPEVLAARAAMPFGKKEEPRPKTGQVVVGSMAPADVLAALQAAKKPSEEPKLTLAQFASITVEIGMSKGPVEPIHARYNVDAAAFEREQRIWRKRMDADPTKSDDYLRMMREYRAWLKSQVSS